MSDIVGIYLITLRYHDGMVPIVSNRGMSVFLEVIEVIDVHCVLFSSFKICIVVVASISKLHLIVCLSIVLLVDISSGLSPTSDGKLV